MPAFLIALFVLGTAHAWIAIDAASHKSPTFDEPMHGLGAFVLGHYGDARMNLEDPPLYRYWQTLGSSRDDLKLDFEHPEWKKIPDDLQNQWLFIRDMFKPGAPNDIQNFVMSQRRPMAVLGGMTIVVAGLFAARVLRPTGPTPARVAGLFVATLLAFDANFLGHSPLLKNDVGMTLTTMLFAWSVMNLVERFSIRNVLLVGLASAAMCAMKFSGVLVGPMLAVALTARALLNLDWPSPLFRLDTIARRVLVILPTGLVCALITYVGIWASYGFRYPAVRDADQPFEFRTLVIQKEQIRRYAITQEMIAPEQAALAPPDRFPRLIMWLNEHHFLPEPWLYGLMFVDANAVARTSFILNRYPFDGTWYYFPLAIAVKTPTATLVAGAAGLVFVGVMGVLDKVWLRWREWALPLVALGTVFSVYAASAMTTTVNLGVRHVLLLFPFLLMPAAIAVAILVRDRVRRSIAAIPILLAALTAIETLQSHPDYIAFFNAPVGGPENALNLLGDSNLDWGQDLPALAEWQQKHPDTTLYLSYFGIVDPKCYGIRYINILPGYVWGEKTEIPDASRPGVIAVSATHLQGIYNFVPSVRDAWNRVRFNAEPREILGGSIFLYDLPLKLKPGANPAGLPVGASSTAGPAETPPPSTTPDAPPTDAPEPTP